MKIQSSPSGTISGANLKTTHISINDLLRKGDEAIDQQRNQAKEANIFSQDELHMAWKSYAYKMRDNGQGTIFSAMTKREPQIIDENKIFQLIDSEVQETFMIGIKGELEDYLRKELKNYAILCQFEVTENKETKVALSNKEKFAAMARKNPSLHTLKTKFGLDFDF